MIAQVTDLEPGTISYSIKDAHIYVNHLKNIKEQEKVDLEFNMMNNEVEKTADILPPTANSTLGSVVEMTTDAAKEAVSEGK